MATSRCLDRFGANPLAFADEVTSDPDSEWMMQTCRKWLPFLVDLFYGGNQVVVVHGRGAQWILEDGNISCHVVEADGRTAKLLVLTDETVGCGTLLGAVQMMRYPAARPVLRAVLEAFAATRIDVLVHGMVAEVPLAEAGAGGAASQNLSGAKFVAKAFAAHFPGAEAPAVVCMGLPAFNRVREP